MIYLNIYFCENFLLFMTTFHHKYLHLLLPTFSKQTLVFIAFEMIIFHHSTRHGITRLISTVHVLHNRHSETKQRKKQDRTDMGRKRVLVSCNCRDLSALHSYSSPPQLAGSGQFTNPKCWYLTVWEWDSTTNYLCGVFRISSDKSSFKFNCFDLSKYVLDKYSGDPRTLQDTT